MARSYEASDLIVIPRLTAPLAGTLGTQVLTMAASHKDMLPPAVAEACDELTVEHTGLQNALSAQLTPDKAPDPAKAREADANVDKAFSGFYRWALGWSMLPGGLPEADIGREIVEAVFADGLRFVNSSYEAEWSAVNTRLKVVDDRQLEPKINQLGGAPILACLRECFETYGKVLGITEALAEAADHPSVRESFLSFNEALRYYVLQVTASVRRRDPATKELADALLKPIVEWETPGGSGSSGSGGGSGSGGASGQ